MSSDFRILGELQVLLDGRPSELGSRRQRRLLACLILRSGQSISTERLLDDLWPEEAPQTARHALHVYVSRLRTALGSERDRLQSDGIGYRLRLSAEDLDAARFERLVADGRAALAAGDPDAAQATLQGALELWRGPALGEFADEPFAAAEAVRLEQLRLATIEDRVWADLDLGKHAALTEELRELTLEQPFREVRWEQYMVALYRSGRQAEALHAYGEARLRLADELGIEPGPALQRAEQQILAQDPGLLASPRLRSAPASDSLPLQRTTFIGRERALAEAGTLLGRCRLLTLTGAPGSGKTRLAIRLATDHAGRYRDGTCFVPLAATTDPRRLEADVAQALGRPRAAPGSPSVQLHEWLHDRELLLVLDNFEQLLEAAPTVGSLLDAAPRLTILVTSRVPLLVTGEQEYHVKPLDLPPIDERVESEELGLYDAVSLLVARARAIDPEFEVTPANRVAVAHITHRLDGLPLAIELAAVRLRSLPPQGLLERLERRLPLLASNSPDAVQRHQTLRGAIAWSYDLLPPEEQRLFRRLGIFRDGFSIDAASAIAELTAAGACDGVEALLAKSLLVRPADVGEARFTMLETIREFALETLDHEGERDEVMLRHVRYYADLAEGLEPELTGEAHDDAMARISRELGNIRAALRVTDGSAALEPAVRLAASIWRFWQRSGRLSEGREWLERLLASGAIADGVRAKALVAAAGLAYWQADLVAATGGYRDALALYRVMGDRTEAAAVLCALSMTATWSGDPRMGTTLATQARGAFEALADRGGTGEALMAEGFARWQLHDYAGAQPLWSAALDIARQLGNEPLAVTQLAGLAGIEFHLGHQSEAQRLARQALSEACRLQNVALSAWLLDFIAAFAATDSPAAAVRLAGAAEASRQLAGGGMRIEDLHIPSARETAATMLEDHELEVAWELGRTWSLDQAIIAAQELQRDPQRSTPQTEPESKP